MDGAHDPRYTPSLHNELQERVGPLQDVDVFLCSTHNWFNWVPGFQFVGLRVLARRGSLLTLFSVNGNFSSLRTERWSGDVSEAEARGSGAALKVRFLNGESVSFIGREAADQLRRILRTA